VNKDTLSSISTLTINNQQLSHLGECINLCYNIQVLHIYENNLVNLNYIENLHNLRILYAQDNKITNADSIQGLNRLEKMYTLMSQVATLIKTI
jgi:Leucine-rich repeat (LRR) protein